MKWSEKQTDDPPFPNQLPLPPRKRDFRFATTSGRGMKHVIKDCGVGDDVVIK